MLHFSAYAYKKIKTLCLAYAEFKCVNRVGCMKKTAALAGLAAMTLLDISAATPASAQNAEAFQGGYVGAHAGYATSETTFRSSPYLFDLLPIDTDIPASARNDKFNFDGGIGGVHTGFNVVSPGNVLFGVEADWTYLGLDDTVTGGESFTFASDGYVLQHRSQIDLEWQSTLRGRLGFISGNTLFFATAGIAFLDMDWKSTDTATSGATTVTNSYSDSELLVGGVVGGGLEIALSPNLIVGADYLYENFGNPDNVPFGHGNGSSTVQSGNLSDLEVHKVRARITLKFGAPAQ